MKLAIDLPPIPFRITGARVAVLGYAPDSSHHALGLRDAGNEVSIGLRAGGMSWGRARQDGFRVTPPCSVIPGAHVVVALVPDEEQASLYCHAIEPNIAPHALLVFGRALALETRAFEPGGVDVVFVTGHDRSCRVAVHHDAGGRALERAIAYARGAFGGGVAIATTTLAAEADAELAALERRAGGVAGFRAQLDHAMARTRDSHAPDEARLSYYEGLCALVEDRARRGTRPRGELAPVVSLAERRSARGSS
jgi:ketol-acid reductoisomerase